MIMNKQLRLYEALAHEAAMDAAQRRELTPEEREISKRMFTLARAHLADLERSDGASRAVRPAIVAMDRKSLLERLGEIFSLQPRAVLAYRDFERLSDNDLRTALEDAESILETLT